MAGAAFRGSLRHEFDDTADDRPSTVDGVEHPGPFVGSASLYIKARGHFPNELAALKCLYLVTRSLDPTGQGRARWMMRWKPALNAFAITFGDRFPAAETY